MGSATFHKKCFVMFSGFVVINCQQFFPNLFSPGCFMNMAPGISRYVGRTLYISIHC